MRERESLDPPIVRVLVVAPHSRSEVLPDHQFSSLKCIPEIDRFTLASQVPDKHELARYDVIFLHTIDTTDQKTLIHDRTFLQFCIEKNIPVVLVLLDPEVVAQNQALIDYINWAKQLSPLVHLFPHCTDLTGESYQEAVRFLELMDKIAAKKHEKNKVGSS